MSAPIDTTSLQGMVVRPGDTLILYSPIRLSDDEIDDLRASVKAQLPELANVAVFEAVLPVAVIRPESVGSP